MATNQADVIDTKNSLRKIYSREDITRSKLKQRPLKDLGKSVDWSHQAVKDLRFPYWYPY